MTRTRRNSQLYPTGKRTRFNDPVYSGVTFMLDETCQDEILEGDNYAFTVNRTLCSGGVIQSDYDGGYFTATFDHYPCDALRNGQLQPNFSFPEALPDAAYASQAVNRTSPSKPYVDIGTNIAECGEIATMLKDWGLDLIKAGRGKEPIYWSNAQKYKRGAAKGQALFRDLGKGNLQYQFGILPVLSDLSKMSQFQDQVNRRVRAIERLKGPHGYRKTVDLASLETSDSFGVVWQSADVYLASTVSRQSYRNIKGHCRWIPGIEFPWDASNAELERLAISAVGGLTIDFSTVWELIPWSWLIDYFTNVGQFISNQRNLVPSSLESVVLIKHSVSGIPIPRLRSGQHEMSPGHLGFEVKERIPVHADVTAYFPFLSGKQMGILSSLAVTRR